VNQPPDGATPVEGVNQLLAGRYLLLDKIGEGGAAVVYRARDQRLDRIVAIKLLRPQFTTDEASRKRFLNEARTAAGLNHPNVVDIYDFGENPDGSMFIAMQYIEGQNLKDLIHRRGHLSPADVVAIIPQVCNALTAAHSRGLIHRDVKPQNIMIDKRGNVLLTDFGIVKALSGPELTQTGMTFGTAAYLSPEQATGELIGPASDVYSLGCVMYEMLAGSPPFTGDNPAVVAYKQVWEQPRPLHDWAPEAPPALENIVMRCLNKDPARRYPTAAALGAELTNLGVAFNRPTQAVTLGAIPAAAERAVSDDSTRPSAEVSHAIPMPAAPAQTTPSQTTPPPVRVQTTGLAGGQVTRRVDPYDPPSTIAPVQVPPRVQVVNPNSRISNAWLPIALAIVALGLLVCGLAVSQGNIFGILGSGSATPTPLTIPTPTALSASPTLAPIVVVTSTATLAATSTQTPAPPTYTPTYMPTAIITPTDTPLPPTDTPAPTIEVPPTVTPAPQPTDTVPPTGLTPTILPLPTIALPLTPVLADTPTVPALPFTPIPAGDNSVTIHGTSFQGGYTNGKPYHGRSAEWVYGQGTPYNTMTASFSIGSNPKGPANMVIVGIDSEDPPKTPVRIQVNDQVVFEGPDPLPNDNGNGPDGPGNWGAANFHLGSKVLRKGVNSVTITNLDPSDKINYPIFVMVDTVSFSWKGSD
jgi:serine/threonine-protein kinase